MSANVASQAECLLPLLGYKAQLDDAIERRCSEVLNECSRKYTPHSRDALEAYCSILRSGGKRLRGALVMHSYKMFGGRDDELALRAAVAIEMVHAFILIVDDICDQSSTRRGVPSAHMVLKHYHEARHLHGNAGHFGVAIGMSIAVAGFQLALQELLELPLDAETKLGAISGLNQALIVTSHGQINDLFAEATRSATSEQVRQFLGWKTAHYTFLAPLRFGADLAQADPAMFGPLAAYSEHAGLAFQIADDILGTFGDEVTTGKSALSDLMEGKATLLVVHALNYADANDREHLLYCLGNPDLVEADHLWCQKLLERTGALDYARQTAETEAEQAIEAMRAAPDSWPPEAIEFLKSLAWHAVARSI